MHKYANAFRRACACVCECFMSAVVEETKAEGCVMSFPSGFLRPLCNGFSPFFVYRVHNKGNVSQFSCYSVSDSVLVYHNSYRL